MVISPPTQSPETRQVEDHHYARPIVRPVPRPTAPVASGTW
jgi:hypothetical protein